LSPRQLFFVDQYLILANDTALFPYPHDVRLVSIKERMCRLLA